MKLSTEERQKRAIDLASLIEKRQGVEDEKKEAVKGFRRDLEAIDHQIERLAWAVNTGMMPEEERQLGLGIDADDGVDDDR